MGRAGVDVGGWLRWLGLGQYEQAFRDSDADADLLARLAAEDLRDQTVTAGSPSTSIIGRTPSPGAVDAASRPSFRRGAPSAMRRSRSC